MPEIYIVIKRPGAPPIGEFLEDNLQNLQAIVGGDIEQIIRDVPEGLALFANMDGKRLNLKQNLFIGPNLFDLIYGTCYFRTADPGVLLMTADQMIAAGDWFRAIAI